MRPGNYVYFDRTQVGARRRRVDDCALTVLARVVSRPAADRVILDSGSKTLTNDLRARLHDHAGLRRGPARVDAAEPDDDRCSIERLSEEHATVRASTGDARR